MKKLLFLTLTLFVLCGSAHAQFAFKGQWNITASAGWIPATNLNLNIGLEKAIGHSYSSFHMKFNFMQNKASLDTPELLEINYQTYQLLLNYNYSFGKLLPHPWYLQLSIGGNLGYENIPDSGIETLVIENKSQFVYGLNVALQLELSVSKSASIFLEPRFIYNINSDIQNGFFITSFGCKFYL